MGWVRQSRLVKKEALIVMGKGGGLQFNVETRGKAWRRGRTMNMRCVRVYTVYSQPLK